MQSVKRHILSIEYHVNNLYAFGSALKNKKPGIEQFKCREYF